MSVAPLILLSCSLALQVATFVVVLLRRKPTSPVECGHQPLLAELEQVAERAEQIADHLGVDTDSEPGAVRLEKADRGGFFAP